MRQRTKPYLSDKNKSLKRAWYANNKERIKANPEYRERSRASSLRHYYSDIERGRQRSRAYMKNYPRDRKARQDAGYRDRNRERLNSKAREYYRNSPERKLACKKHSEARKVKLRGAPVVDSSVDRLVVYRRDRGVCHLCGLLADRRNFHMDHIIPVSKGGAHCYSNVAVSHPDCNRKKGNRIVPSKCKPGLGYGEPTLNFEASA